MKVLFVDRTSARGGAPRSLALTLTGLVDRGVDVRLVAEFPSPAEAALEPSRVTRVSDRPPGPGGFRRLRAKARDVRLLGVVVREMLICRPDLVHFNLGTPAVRVLLAVRLFRPVVVHERGLLPRRRIDFWLDRKVVDLHIAVSHSLLTEQRVEGRWVVAENPVNAPSGAAMSHRPGCQEQIVVLAAGRDDPQKGFDVLESAVSGLPRVDCRIAGPSKESRVANVDYLGWVEDMDELVSECDLVCVPSLYGEGMPRIVLQALRRGRPVVASDIPALRAVLPKGGVFFAPGDARGLRDVLKGLEKDRRTLASLSDDAFNAKVGNLPSELAGILMDCYTKVLS